MRILFTGNSWEDSTSWLNEDRKMLKRINELIKEIQRTPYEGKGVTRNQKYSKIGNGSTVRLGTIIQ